MYLLGVYFLQWTGPFCTGWSPYWWPPVHMIATIRGIYWITSKLPAVLSYNTEPETVRHRISISCGYVQRRRNAKKIRLGPTLLALKYVYLNKLLRSVKVVLRLNPNLMTVDGTPSWRLILIFSDIYISSGSMEICGITDYHISQTLQIRNLVSQFHKLLLEM